MHECCSKCKSKIKKGVGYYIYTFVMLGIMVWCLLIGVGVVEAGV